MTTTNIEIEIRNHNGQCAYGDWETYSPETIYGAEIAEAIYGASGKIEGSSGTVTVGGQKYLWRLAR